MTVLQGTMSDGTLIPVQADSQGRLVCEGLQGPEGPQGPPGVGQLPPNPKNGDVLAWDNGLVWVSGVIPVGPPWKSDEITAVNTSGAQPVLTFATDKDLANFANGDAIVQENSTVPPIYTNNWTETGPGNAYNKDKFFAPVTVPPTLADTTGGFQSGTALLTLDTPVPITSTFTFYSTVASGPGGIVRVTFSDGSSFTAARPDDTNVQTYSVPGKAGLSFTGFGVDDAPFGGVTIGPFVVDGVQVVDGTGPLPSGTVGSVDVAAKTMTLATSAGTWGPANAGHYVISTDTPVLYGNKFTPHR